MAIAIFGAVGQGVPFVNANLGALAAIVFLYVPVYLGGRRGEDLGDYGFVTAPVARGLAFAGGYIAAVLPLFTVGFVFFYDVVCAHKDTLGVLAPGGLCHLYGGWEGRHWPAVDWATAEMVLVQLVVVALPEELFFRGFIHKLCERAIPPRRRILSGGIGWALVLSSALFAVVHLAVGPDPRRLAVFFPGLVFGWMRSATGSILAGTLAHTFSNLFIQLLQRSFF